ncbi:MAG TPA: hypothetical protein VGX48_19310 [Pyrinomonadaceae bacterium]|nr:hypothetical protein [Pyrinomonadaceae bacterium]
MPAPAAGFRTNYSYDALGNLRRVEQPWEVNGQQTVQRRFFMYASLSRLIRVKNPEQGALTADASFPSLTDLTCLSC